MKYLLFEIVARELATTIGFTIDEIYEKLEQPPNPDMGDVSFPCFTLAKYNKKPPKNVAEEIKELLISQNSIVFSQIDVVGGYLNFYLTKKGIYSDFFKRINENTLIDNSSYIKQKITIEHTSVNPNASPHIGRARNAIIGNSISRLFKYLGCDVTVHYFVNDIGKQIALLATYTKDKTEISFNELLNLYVEANNDLKTNKKLEDNAFIMLSRMEDGDNDVFHDFSRIVDICIKGQTAIFNEFGIQYDKFDYESQYVQSHRTNEVLQLLSHTGRLFEDEEGRLVLNLDEFKLNAENPYLPLTRNDKTSLYPLRDICYNIDKSNEGSSRNIVVLGEDQRIYGRQINAALSLLGFKGAEIVNYSFVLLPEGKMSTRMGQVVLLEDLMRDTVSFAKNSINERRTEINNDTNYSEIDDILAKKLAYGAIKYSILKCSNDKNVIFDSDQALNFQGNTSVYIQYSYARIRSLLKNEDFQVHEEQLSNLSHPLEWELVKKILSFNKVLSVVSNDFNFVSLCGYLYDLCQVFSRWYKECNIKSVKDDLKNARLFLATAVSNVVKDGLYILGIDAPDRI